MSVMASPVVEYPEVIAPILREGYGYWRAKRGDRPFPARADFDPIAECILVCTAPGPMPVSPARLPFKRLAIGMRLEPMGAAFVPPEPALAGGA